MRNDKGMIMVLGLLLLVVLTIIGISAVSMGIFDVKISANHDAANQVFYSSDAGLEDARSRFDATAPTPVVDNEPDNPNWTVAIGTQERYNQKGLSGITRLDKISTDLDYFVTIKHKLNASNQTLKWGDANGDGISEENTTTGVSIYVITSEGLSKEGSKKTLQTEVIRLVAQPKVWTAVGANGSINTIGNFNADGRNYDPDGLTPLCDGNGSTGLSTRTTVSLGGSSAIGGTVNGVDYAPPSKGLGDPGVVKENSTWSQMTSVDNALGLPEGTLKSLAQANGTYYTNSGQVPSTIHGVTYVEGDFSTADGDGILIVAGNLGNFHGTFKGIIIAQSLNKANGNSLIVGSVLTLSTASADVLNGTCDILFSRQRVQASCALVGKAKTLSWKEVF